MKISDEVLIEELKNRLDDNKKALFDMSVMNGKLESLNAKLADSERLKGDFLSNIRNEINNPLTSIMGSAKQLARGNMDLETANRVAQMIYNEALDLDFQLRNIFTAAELEAGETTLGVSNVDIGMLIRDVIDSFSHRVLEKRLIIETRWNVPQEAGDQLYFKTDAEKLDRILSNLLANAIEFNKDGKSVKITVGKEDNRLNISFEDEGIGIPDEQRENIFARFRQLDCGARRSHRGHGLGLSITKALAEMLDGKVSFSRADGGGCIFSIIMKEAETETGIETVSEESNEFIF